ncbi:unnamed protein product [Vitrella brassicaformis CCMP3155]|uniref:Fibronectin type III-like domain-containing protein n=2 Tax=Vitrella brassicaformis TaxID=1169539 RepID=A0A0G4EN26_VITBC|nr:unnamed protein product [Vitrella brassicaformis CCMP3155]|eukprot:CEL98230.1 unnamed protein product [Vitrella brassicaformis CCMP3155]
MSALGVLLTLVGVILAACALLWFLTPSPHPLTHLDCLPPFERCAEGRIGSCVLSKLDCDLCPAKHYACPGGRKVCASSPSDYLRTCKAAVNGTLFDWSLSDEGRITAFLRVATVTEKAYQLANEATEIARLSLPSYAWLNDDVHGVRTEEATTFPNGNALGASWDRELVHGVARRMAMEARGTYNYYTWRGDRGKKQNGRGITIYSPNINLVRDPRWGRADEVYSEDPLLTSQLTIAYVKGVQSPSARNPSGRSYPLTAACCKHFAAYDIETIPRDRTIFNARVDGRDMAESYLPAFHACVKEAKAMHVMCSYNAINNIPTCAEPRLLNGLLRDKWGFDGFVVSDYDAWRNLKDTWNYAPDRATAAVFGLEAGMDQEGGGMQVIRHIPLLVEEGRLNISQVDEALRRVMRVRLRLGMLDPPSWVSWNSQIPPLGPHIPWSPSPPPPLPPHDDFPPHHPHMDPLFWNPSIQLAFEAALSAMSLYKNHQSVLPLHFSKIEKLALIGPFAECGRCLCGGYTTTPKRGLVSIHEGLERSLGRGKVATVLGCLNVKCLDTSQFDRVRDAVKGSSVVVLTLGLDETLEREGHDRSSYELPRNQYALLDEVVTATKGTGIPIVAVLVHGGTFTLSPVLGSADAVLDAWLPGQAGGLAVAYTLFGFNSTSPAGRASVTWYENTTSLPPMGRMSFYPSSYDRPEAPSVPTYGITYRYYTHGTPTIPFGYGLSYTAFAYTNMRLNKTTYAPCEQIGVTVDVRNVGRREGDEVVQLYVEQTDSPTNTPRPNIRLADFKRVHLSPNQTATVRLSLAPALHSVVLEQEAKAANPYAAEQVVEPGKRRLFIGGQQPHWVPPDGRGLTALPDPLWADLFVDAQATVSECERQTWRRRRPTDGRHDKHMRVVVGR